MTTAVQTLVEQLAGQLSARGEMLATAESCTGGGVAAACTDMPGSSAWFDRGFVTYSNAAKEEMLGVPGELLSRCGAVSEETVLAMVEGALRRSRAAWALAISGIAGPGGGTTDKPVGTVWFAWGGPDGWRLARRLQFAGDRSAVRAQAIEMALRQLIERCDAIT